MQRTFNYTGRKKIMQNEALFSLSGTENKPSFNVEFRINETDFPINSSLYVEAYNKETRQRFNFGNISRITPPKNTCISEIDLSGPTLFRVLIVDETESNGKLIARGDNFRADRDINEEKDRVSLLSVSQRPLEQEVWKIDLESEKPELCINKNIPNAIDKIRSDSNFQALILPAALKQVLLYFVWNEEDEEESEIYKQWLEFAENLGDTKPNSNDPTELIRWIDEVVLAFSNEFSLCSKLIDTIKED